MTLTVREIENSVREYFDIKRDLFISNRRDRSIARPRQIAMYLARKHTNASLPQIGMHFCRDHTTVLHAVKRIEELRESNELVKGYIPEIEVLLAVKDNLKAAAAKEHAQQPLVRRIYSEEAA